jgi:hypothetical protein
MITEEQYIEALQIIEQYEYEQKTDVDDDFNEDDNHHDFDENDTRYGCKCGAWQLGKNGLVHVADCICGAG